MECKKCRGRDLNPRTSTGTDLESVAFDQAWLPLQQESENVLPIIKVMQKKITNKLNLQSFLRYFLMSLLIFLRYYMFSLLPFVKQQCSILEE